MSLKLYCLCNHCTWKESSTRRGVYHPDRPSHSCHSPFSFHYFDNNSSNSNNNQLQHRSVLSTLIMFFPCPNALLMLILLFVLMFFVNKAFRFSNNLHPHKLIKNTQFLSHNLSIPNSAHARTFQASWRFSN